MVLLLQAVGKTVSVDWLKLTMKQNPDRPRSGSRPPRPGLGRFAGEPPRLSTPPLRAGGARALLLPGGRNGGGEEVLGGLWEWPLRLGGRPPKSPGSRSSWNMSTNSCCSSSKVSCTYGTIRSASAHEVRSRRGLQHQQRWHENILDA
jgi:hypothetical protein